MLHRQRLGLAGHAGSDGAGEAFVLPERVDRPSVRARNRHQRAVIRRHLVQKDQAGDHVVIGVRIEGEILMPAHLGARAREFAIDLGVMQPQIRADQIRQHLDHRRAVQERPIGLGNLGRRLYPTKRRCLGGVTGLNVETRAAVQGLAEGAAMGPALLDPAGEVGVEGGDGLGIDHALDRKTSGLVKRVDLLLGKGVGHGVAFIICRAFDPMGGERGSARGHGGSCLSRSPTFRRQAKTEWILAFARMTSEGRGETISIALASARDTGLVER